MVSKIVLFCGLANLATLAHAASMCLMVYQMADNDLEYFIRQDNLEIIKSSAVKEPSLSTWVYFDGRDYTRGSNDNIYFPLRQVWEKDGTPVEQKTEGSQYLTYDHSMKKMVVDTRLQGEQNGDSPQTIFNFVTHALQDCVSRGTKEYVIVFSSHGSGFLGFGGDENPNRRRSLSQSNGSIASALQAALGAVQGAPAKYDVIAFDACLMSALSALYHYSSLAQYYLASEATEPGHGWAYQELADVSSSLNLARDFHRNFLAEPQGFSHQSPKTLSLIETASFNSFYTAFEGLATELKLLLDADNDPDFFALLQRSRASSVHFDSVLDNAGSDNPSAVDIGSFFQTLDDLCRPHPASELRARLDDALSSYNDMFVVRGNGPGTPEATGMHVMFPFKQVYKQNAELFDYFLFDDESVANTAPEWFAFVRTYLDAATPTNSFGAGLTCTKTATGDVVATRPGQLLINPRISVTPTSAMVSSAITTTTDFVFVEYGIDATPWLYTRRRKLANVFKQLPQSARGLGLEHSKHNPLERLHRSLWRKHVERRKMIQSDSTVNNRRREQEDDYLFVLGGSVKGYYDGPFYSASWNRLYYAIGDDDSFTPIYIYDDGDGARAIPVFYFPAGIDITSDKLSYDTTVDDALEMGAVFGSLEFGIDRDNEIITSFTLMTNDGTAFDSPISETPPSALGSIVPLIFVDGQVEGIHYSEIVGGVDGTVIEWNEEKKFALWVMDLEAYSTNYGVRVEDTYSLMDMYASNFDLLHVNDPSTFDEGFDWVSFVVDTSGSGWGKRPFVSILLLGIMLVRTAVT